MSKPLKHAGDQEVDLRISKLFFFISVQEPDRFPERVWRGGLLHHIHGSPLESDIASFHYIPNAFLPKKHRVIGDNKRFRLAVLLDHHSATGLWRWAPT